MGVPKFYRWLSERYPQINQIISDSSLLPEIDNLYLDMNGIIHACTHPNDNDTANSLTLREMMFSIFRYIDRMVTEIAKPKKLLFMAIDGVAPRAKLNQQRARRFRAAQDRIESVNRARQRGEVIDESAMFDSNCITPGTEFMELVGKHIRWFIRKKIKEDPLWRNLDIVFSGHDVPGEGEHKIMQYIREARAKPGYEPNQRHCMYGQDADLIMLGLATHEPHFTLLREVVNFSAGRPNKGSARETVLRQTRETQFQLMHLSILREYLELELAIGAPFALDKERLVDDFIFLTFLVGNDFLPHLPTLDIGEHAFDVIYTAYKSLVHTSTAANPPYIVQNGELGDLPMLERLFKIIGSQEAEILMNREDEVKSFNARLRKNKDNIVPTDEELEEAEEERQRLYELAVQEALYGEGAAASASGAGEKGASASNPLGNDDDRDDDQEEEEEEEQFQTAGKPRKAPKSDKKSKSSGDTAPPGAVKDYRGRYYFEKFKVVVGSGARADLFMTELMQNYLQGLMWCLAYYVKGCISWTWYYPYHYGPMLQDMTQLSQISGHIQFSIGQPFRPFQQLLGCLPPASRTMLPRCYQWLMTSTESPMLKYYPEEFGIDQDGKKNPWEAVVLLSFIDERDLLAAEALHCKEDLLSVEERQRNTFGKVLAYAFDPNVSDTYFSCNPEIGLPDVSKCQSTVNESFPDLSPGAYFRPELIPGTISPIAGFPSLAALRMQKVETDFFKINVFGSESRYRTMVMEVEERDYDPSQLDLSILIGKIVYVNYPQMHEAKVVAIVTAAGELRMSNKLDASGKPDIVRTPYDAKESEKWTEECEQEADKYFKGRCTPGSGGLRIGSIRIRLRVCVLQGMRRDPVTGASKKVYGTDEADIPIQLALWSAPTVDPRFQETEEQPVAVLFPHGGEVVATYGQLVGCKGRVVGPHGPGDSGTVRSSLRKAKAKQDTAAAAASTDNSSAEVKGGESKEEHKENNSVGTDKSKEKETKEKTRRVVDVEFHVPPPEPSFGHAIAESIQEEYFPSRDVVRSLGISPSVLGKIVGSIFVEPGRYDLGLNLKRNGQYQLLGYVRKVVYDNSSHGESSSSTTAAGGGGGKGAAYAAAWGHGDTVQVVGMLDNSKQSDALESTQWEYSAKAIALLFDYKNKFPMLFDNLERLPHQKRYGAHELVPASAVLPPSTDGKPLDPTAGVEAVKEWMKLQPFFAMPRTPLTTLSLSREAMRAIERASDVRTSYLVASGTNSVVVNNVPVEYLYRGELAQTTDAPLAYNGSTAPRLGDRVVNLKATGVPFGLRGTVVAMHSSTGYVEAIFDEEFVGGRGLQGNCSQFRGRLCAWNALLRVSAVHHSDKNHGHGTWGHDSQLHGHKVKSAVAAAAHHPTHTSHTSHSGLDVKDVVKIVAKSSVGGGGKKPTSTPTSTPAATPALSPKAEAEKARSILLRRVGDGAPAVTVAGVEAGNKLLKAISSKGGIEAARAETTTTSAATSAASTAAASATVSATDMSSILKQKLNISTKERVADPSSATTTATAAPPVAPVAAAAPTKEESKIKITKEVATVATGAGGAAFRILVKTDEPNAEAIAAAEDKKKKRKEEHDTDKANGGGKETERENAHADDDDNDNDLVNADIEIEVDSNFKSDGTGRAALAMAAGAPDEDGEVEETLSPVLPPPGPMHYPTPGPMHYPPMPMPYPFMLPGFLPHPHPGMMPLPMFAPLPPHMMPPFIPMLMPYPFPPPPPPPPAPGGESSQQQQQHQQQQQRAAAGDSKGRTKSPTKRAANPQNNSNNNKPAEKPSHTAAATAASASTATGGGAPEHKKKVPVTQSEGKDTKDKGISKAKTAVPSKDVKEAAHTPVGHKLLQHIKTGGAPVAHNAAAAAPAPVPAAPKPKHVATTATAAAVAVTTAEGADAVAETKKTTPKKLSATEKLQNAKKAMIQAKATASTAATTATATAAATTTATGASAAATEKVDGSSADADTGKTEGTNAGTALMAMLASASTKEKTVSVSAAVTAAAAVTTITAIATATATAVISSGGSTNASAVSALKAMLGSTKEKPTAATAAATTSATVTVDAPVTTSNAGGNALKAFLTSSSTKDKPSAATTAAVDSEANNSNNNNSNSTSAYSSESVIPTPVAHAIEIHHVPVHVDKDGKQGESKASLVPASVLVRKKTTTATPATTAPATATVTPATTATATAATTATTSTATATATVTATAAVTAVTTTAVTTTTVHVEPSPAATAAATAAVPDSTSSSDPVVAVVADP